MPPTDMMKKLSRTDPLATDFSVFLQVQGIISKGDEDILVNPMPYTSIMPFITEAHEVRFYRCFATSVCIPFKVLAIKNGSEVRYAEYLVAFNESTGYVIENDVLHIFNLDDKAIRIITKSRLDKIKLLDTMLRSRYILGIDKEDHEVKGVYALSLYSNSKVLSLASSEPIVVEFTGGRIIRLFVPRSDLLSIASKPYYQLLRNVYVHSNTVSTKGSIRNSQALIEILDPITLAQPRGFDRGCVDLVLLNLENIDYNAMIKAYGYIDEVVIDGLTTFKTKHSILRIALPAFAKSEIKLCISTYMPRRADITYKLKMFEQASL